jgi:hypothetical protein
MAHVWCLATRIPKTMTVAMAITITQNPRSFVNEFMAVFHPDSDLQSEVKIGNDMLEKCRGKFFLRNRIAREPNNEL